MSVTPSPLRTQVPRLLIANRGEPVMRAIRTCRSLGIEPAVVFCGDDAASDWVAAADCAYRLGGGGAGGMNPYLDITRVVEVAVQNGCAAIWPGWGFLSEDAALAEAVVGAGLIWVGPPPSAMRLLGSKLEAPCLAREAGFQTIPEIQMEEGAPLPGRLAMACPVVVKPAAGGGGKGQEVVWREADFPDAAARAARLARILTGSGGLIVQRYLEGTRHIELQLMRDAQGTACVIGARDCSIQRRNQKIIEEAPAIAVGEALFAQAKDAAKRLFAAAGYTGAGTVEMLLAGGELFFLEVNARLQVEHTVTEESTRIAGQAGERRLDLLVEMLSVACGHPLSFTEREIRASGHAIEARIYAEDPDGGFAPTPGKVYFVRFPHGEGIRVDAALSGPEGTVSQHFDPMMAKVIASGVTREEAAGRLQAALEKTVVLGIRTNIDFLRRIASHPRFLSGAITTAFIADEREALAPRPAGAGLAACVAALVAYRDDYAQAFEHLADTGVVNLEDALARMPDGAIAYGVTVHGKRFAGEIRQWAEGRYAVAADGGALLLDADPVQPHVLALREAGGRVHECYVHRMNGEVQIVLDGEYVIAEVEREGRAAQRKDPHAAPYGGRLIATCVRQGQRVSPGDPLYILETMKMEGRIRAACSGRIEAVLASPGDAIAAGDIVVQMAPDAQAPNTLAEERLPLPPAGRDPLLSWIFCAPPGGAEGEQPPSRDHRRGAEIAQDVCELFFQGYDIPADAVRRCFPLIAGGDPAGAIALVSRCVQQVVSLRKLRGEEMADLLLDVVRLRRPPPPGDPSREAFAQAIEGYGTAAGNRDEVLRVLPRLLMGLKNQGPKQAEVLVEMIERLAEGGAEAEAFSPPILSLLASGLLEGDAPLKGRLLAALGKVDRREYYRHSHPPVAIDYLDEYERFIAGPLSSLSHDDLLRMQGSLTADEGRGDAVDPSLLPQWFAGNLQRWFEGFRMRPLSRSEAAAAAGVRCFELTNLGEEREKRLVAVGIVPQERAPDRPAPPSFAHIERTAIESYTLIAQYRELGGSHALNHVFLVCPPDLVVEWNEGGDTPEALSPARLKGISSRIAGFARNIRVLATDVIIALRRGAHPSPHIIEVRHAQPAGLVSRPPYLLSERMPERAKDARRRLDQKQEELGKLLNEDRARILFDAGRYEELSFPDCDEGPLPVGLKVYRGAIHGVPALAYAGDFRIKGGALGEREGKKLAASVVLAYACRMPLVGIHDGAGADIRGSVASLGWAGTYFGAIANTGGFSTEAQFWRWFDGHLERPYFEKVLKQFGARRPERAAERAHAGDGRFVHIHLNIGATVGMLVYGASISSMSIMADHPEVYRVLTGAATVKRVTGESNSNYGLGGAPVHARHSGDVDIVCKTEEEVIACARRALALLMPAKSDEAPPQRRPRAEGGGALDKDSLCAAFERGSFLETRKGMAGAASLVTGYGKLSGITVGMAASLSNYGVRSAAALKKLSLLYAGCQEFGLPLVVLVRDRWDNVPEGAGPAALAERAEGERLFAALTVPRIAIAIGPRSFDAPIHHQADICLVVRDGTESGYDIQRAAALAHVTAEGVPEGWERLSQLLPLLVKQERAGAEAALSPQLALPSNFSEAYDVRALIRSVLDQGSFVELHEGDGEPLVVGLGALGGRAIGVMADDPNVASGAQTASSLRKFTRFNRLCERLRIPLIEFNDSPGFQPGSKQERSGIQGEGGKSLREECLGTVQRLSVTLRQNYGGRFIHANLKTLGPGRTALIAEGARVGVMGAEGAVGVLYGKRLQGLSADEREGRRQELLREYAELCLDPRKAVERGLIDRIIPLDQLRSAMLEWVQKEGLP